MNRIVGSLLFLSDLLLRAMDPRTVAALWQSPLKCTAAKLHRKMKPDSAPCSRGTRQHHAFTLIELAVVTAAIMLLAVVFLPALAKGKYKSSRVNCVNNLKQVGLSFRVFANDNEDKLPWQLATNRGGSLGLTDTEQISRHFLAMSNELATPKILICPADTRKPATSWSGLSRTNISYFVSLDAVDTLPQMLLSGDRNLTTNGVPAGPGLVLLTANTVWGWTKEMHRDIGNVVLGDGSVQQATSTRLAGQAGAQGVSTNRLLIP